MTTAKQVKKTVEKNECFIILGPPIVLLYFARTLTATVLTDLIVYRTCLISLHINASECSMLKTNTSSHVAEHLEPKVEPHAGMIVMSKSLIESLLPAIVSIFLGPWSDRGGRRSLFLLAFSGFSLQFFMLSLMCIRDISPWYLLIAVIPTNIVGGLCTVKLAAACYVSDTTADNQKTTQLTLVEVSICVGNSLGGFVGPLIYKHYGDIMIFGTAAACCTFALAYTFFRIPETCENASKESSRGHFKLSLVKELVNAVFMKRKCFQRSVIWLAIFTITLSSMVYKGDVNTIEFLFTRARLSWNVENYSYFNAVDSALRITGLMCSVVIRQHVPGIPDMLIAGTGLTSALGGAITKSLAWKSWHMYFSVCIGMFNEIMSPVLRAVISNVVPAQDIGKVFTVTALLEILSPLVGAPLYTLIYSNYLPPIYPSPVYLLSISFYMLLILCVTIIEVLIRKSRTSHVHAATAQTHM